MAQGGGGCGEANEATMEREGWLLPRADAAVPASAMTAPHFRSDIGDFRQPFALPSPPQPTVEQAAYAADEAAGALLGEVFDGAAEQLGLIVFDHAAGKFLRLQVGAAAQPSSVAGTAEGQAHATLTTSTSCRAAGSSLVAGRFVAGQKEPSRFNGELQGQEPPTFRLLDKARGEGVVGGCGVVMVQPMQLRCTCTMEVLDPRARLHYAQ
eukprot:SAG11_NODE_1775_length_4269_cov_3.089448_5_plen_210_part_00